MVKHMRTYATVAAAASLVMAGAFSTNLAPAAEAAGRNGVCDAGEFCYYYHSNFTGSVSDFTSSLPEYGTNPATCYVFKGAGDGKGLCIKNNAASVWNRSNQPVRVYYHSDFGGAYQTVQPGQKVNLIADLKNDNASHRFLGDKNPTDGCSTAGLGNPRTCSEAVAWAYAHLTTKYVADYDHRCDHVTGLAYGFSYSGSPSAYKHWLAVPSQYKHPGDRSVPAGGLVFFSDSSYGHAMISLGGGKFASNDIHGKGTYSITTIEEIERRWGMHYLGWTQPWFQANH